jgi:hypothetical protein
LVGRRAAERRHRRARPTARANGPRAELDLSPGDAHVVGPGHDAWVVGGEPCVTTDFAAAKTAATAGEDGSAETRIARCPGGVEFRVQKADHLSQLVTAVQQHPSTTHGKNLSKDHVLASLASV